MTGSCARASGRHGVALPVPVLRHAPTCPPCSSRSAPRPWPRRRRSSSCAAPSRARDGARIAECARQAAARFGAGGRLFAFGNGGSATDAQQLATLFLNPGGDRPRPLPAFGLANDTSVVTALCNDVGVEVVFARQLAAFGGRDDIAVGLSTSGNSGNLLRAFDEASRRGMLTIGLAGYDGGKMAELDSIDYLFVVPSSSVHRIQEAQTTIYQVLWELTSPLWAR